MEKPSVPATKHERKPSIDEPKTLSAKQVDLAREAALEVVNNNSFEEATRIFLAGMEPVGTVVRVIMNEDQVCKTCGRCISNYE